jgi:hypothetical protein
MHDNELTCTWRVEASDGLETAWAGLSDGRLAARDRAVGLVPEPYWVAYALETGDRYVTRRLAVQVDSAAGTDSLELLRSAGGTWVVSGPAHSAMPACGFPARWAPAAAELRALSHPCPGPPSTPLQPGPWI